MIQYRRDIKSCGSLAVKWFKQAAKRIVNICLIKEKNNSYCR